MPMQCDTGTNGNAGGLGVPTSSSCSLGMKRDARMHRTETYLGMQLGVSYVSGMFVLSSLARFALYNIYTRSRLRSCARRHRPKALGPPVAIMIMVIRRSTHPFIHPPCSQGSQDRRLIAPSRCIQVPTGPPVRRQEPASPTYDRRGHA